MESLTTGMLNFGRAKSDLERRLGYRFREPELLEQAVTHRSYANERGLPHNNERLEFLGDSVLGLVTVEWLYSEHPEVPEGDLSKFKGRLVSEGALEEQARRIGLGEHIRLGIGEDRSGGRDKRSILADAMEAVIGAVYLDGGLKAARKLVLPMLDGAAGDIPAASMDDAKTRLQETVQARGWPLPRYKLVGAKGPDHEKIFEVACSVRGEVLGRGEGRSKKQAERRAAAEALAALKSSS